MNIILLTSENFINEQQAVIKGNAFKHCLETLKVTVEDTLSIGLINHAIGTGIVRQINTDNILIDTAFNLAPPAKLPLKIILTMPRPKVLKRVLRNAAEFGIDEIILLNAFKVEKSYWQSPVISDAERYFQEGLEQAKDCVMPKLSVYKRFKPFVEDVLRDLIRNDEAFVAHPYNNNNSNSHVETLTEIKATEQTRWVVIGPEGGFIPYEIEKLLEAGCKPLSMGKRIYRVENAVSLLVQGLS